MRASVFREKYRRSIAHQPTGRFERAHGEIIAVSRQPWVQVRVKARIWRALDGEITAPGLPCQPAPDGLAVGIDGDTDDEPDALAQCGPPLPDDATTAPDPVIAGEVLSPATARLDALSETLQLPPARLPPAVTSDASLPEGDQSAIAPVMAQVIAPVASGTK
jgi:hypothetical protein